MSFLAFLIKKHYICTQIFIQSTMADNYLERQYAEYEKRKAERSNPTLRKAKPRTKFYTRLIGTGNVASSGLPLNTNKQ